VNSVYDLERLISNCSGSESEISSLYEEETTLIRQEACSDEAKMVSIGKKTERQDVCNEKERSCINSVVGCSKKEQRNHPCQHPKSSYRKSNFRNKKSIGGATVLHQKD